MQRRVPSYELHYQGRPAEVVEVSISLDQAQTGSSIEQMSVQVHVDQVCTQKLSCHQTLPMHVGFLHDYVHSSM